MMIAVAAGEAENLLHRLRERGVAAANLVGEVMTEPREKIMVDYQHEERA